MRFSIIFSIFTLFSFTTVDSQIKVNALVQNDKGSPIPYATVFNSATNRGVITNVEGRFEIDCSTSDSITIRCIGYKEHKCVAEQLQNTGIVFLKNAVHELNEVVVTPIDVKSIIKKFHANIQRNYPKKAAKISGIYKGYSLVWNEYYGYIQCDLDVFIESIASKSPPSYQTKVYDYTSLRSSDENKKKWQIDADYSFSLFWLYKYSFLWDFKKYQYNHAGYTTYNEAELIKINFHPKNTDILKMQFTGTLYIDNKTYALVFLHYELKQPYVMDFISYKGNWQKTETLENKIMFEFYDGFYYPTYVISKATMTNLQLSESTTVDYLYNFFTKHIEYNPKKFVGDTISPVHLINTGTLNQSSDYKSDFILETEQEKQLLER